jgi:hypothetical protein
MQIPGTESFSTMATAFAGGGSFAFAGRSAQSAPPRLAPPVNAADLLEGVTEGSQQQQQQQQLHGDGKQRTGIKKGMKGLAKRFRALLGSKQSSSSSSVAQQQQQLPHRVQPAGSFAGRVGSSASAPAAVLGEDGSMSVDLMAHIDMDYAAEGLLSPAGRQVSTYSAYSGRNPSVTGSIGYYQSGPSNTGSYPSWTGIGGQTYGSITGQCASLTLQQQRLALLQLQQQSFAGSFGSASAGSSAGTGSYENFGEKLKMLRAMYGSQYSSDACKPPAAAAAAAAAGMNTGAVAGAAGMYSGPPPAAAVGAGPLSSMEPLPALKEEADMPPAAAAAAADNSSLQQFMQKLSKAFGSGPKQQQDDEAGDVLGSGLSLTERSNSSFSLFLARVASGWRHDSSSTAPATFHEDSYPPLAVGRSSFRHTTSVNPSLPSMGAESNSSAAANAAAAVAAMAAANAAAAAAAGSTSQTAGVAAAASAGAAGAGVERSCASFSRMCGPRPAASSAAAAAGPHPMDACAAAAAVETSGRSFSKLFGSCAGGEAHPAAGIEQSRGSFSELFDPCFDAAGSDANPAAAAAAAAMHAIEPNRSSFSRLLSAGRADSSGPVGGPAAMAAAAAAAGTTAVPGVEHSWGSFSKLFGPCASAQGLAGVEHSRGSFSRLLGACGGAGSDPNAAAAAAAAAGVMPAQGVEHSRGSFSKLLAPFGSCAGLDASSAAVEAGAAAAGVGHEAGVERSSRSFSRLLGPCGGDFNAAALVEGSSRSFNKLFSSCSGCAGDVNVVGGSASAAVVTTAEEATHGDATMTGQDAAAAAAAGLGQGVVPMGGAGAVAPYEQQPTWMQQGPPANFSLQQQQQAYLPPPQLAEQQQQQQQHAVVYPALHASLLLPAVPKIAVAEQQAAYTAEPAADMLADTALL